MQKAKEIQAADQKKVAPWREFEKEILKKMEEIENWKVKDHNIGHYKLRKDPQDETNVSVIKLEEKVLIPDFRLYNTRTFVFILDAKHYVKSSISKGQIKQVEEYRESSKSSGSALIILSTTTITKGAKDLAQEKRVRIFRFDNNFVKKVTEWLNGRVKEHQLESDIHVVNQEIKYYEKKISECKDNGWITRYRNSIEELEKKIKRKQSQKNKIMKTEWEMNLEEIDNIQG